MARKIRVQFLGAIYHVLDRGDRRDAIYGDDEDRRGFLTTLAEACERTGWRVHAYVLMSNHYHLMLETHEPNLVGHVDDAIQPAATAERTRPSRALQGGLSG